MFIDNPVQKYIYICDFKETKPGKLPFESPWLRISSFGADLSQKLFECHVCWVKIDLDRNTIYLVPFSRKPIPDLIDWLILISYLLVSVKKESPYPYPPVSTTPLKVHCTLIYFTFHQKKAYKGVEYLPQKSVFKIIHLGGYVLRIIIIINWLLNNDDKKCNKTSTVN